MTREESPLQEDHLHDHEKFISTWPRNGRPERYRAVRLHVLSRNCVCAISARAFQHTRQLDIYSAGEREPDSVEVAGAGGGGGGADSNNGGDGANGARVTAIINVSPGNTLSGTIGGGGGGGYTAGNPTFGFGNICQGSGAGGSGAGAGGAGANVNCRVPAYGYSGGGGGGGGGTTFQLNGLSLFQAGGGGGGGFTGGAAGASKVDSASATGGSGGTSCYRSNAALVGTPTINNTGGSGGLGRNDESTSALTNPGSAGSVTITYRIALSVAKSVSAASDPVNGTTNPKLIPGGTARYCLLVTNFGAKTVNNFTMSDTLDSRLTYIPGQFRFGSTCNNANSIYTGTMSQTGNALSFTVNNLIGYSSYAITFNAMVN